MEMTGPTRAGEASPGVASLTFEVCKRPGKRADGRQTAAGPTVTIGRSPRCSICFESIPIVSEVHATIEVRGSGATVIDCGSHNGTYVNGDLLAGPTPLTLNDEIGLGLRGPRLRLVAIHKPKVSHPAAEAAVPAEMTAVANYVEPSADGGVERTRTRYRPPLMAATAAAALILVGLLLLVPMYVGWRGLVRRLEPSIASLVMERRGEVFPEITLSWSGSGFLVDRHGRLATTLHLVALADAVSVRFGEAKQSIESKGTVFASRPLDLAVIEVNPAAVERLSPIRLASAAPSPGEEIVVIGSPGGDRFEWTVGAIEKVEPLRGVKASLGSDEFTPRNPASVQAAIEKLLAELRSIRTEYERRGDATREDFLDELTTIDGGIKLTRRDLVTALETDLMERRRAAAESGMRALADDTELVVLAADIAPENAGWPVIDGSGVAVGVNLGGFRLKDGDRPFRFAIGVRQLVANLPPAGATVTAFRSGAR